MIYLAVDRLAPAYTLFLQTVAAAPVVSGTSTGGEKGGSSSGPLSATTGSSSSSSPGGRGGSLASKIQVEAYRKLILVSILLNGKALPALPKFMAPGERERYYYCVPDSFNLKTFFLYSCCPYSQGNC